MKCAHKGQQTSKPKTSQRVEGEQGGGRVVKKLNAVFLLKYFQTGSAPWSPSTWLLVWHLLHSRSCWLHFLLISFRFISFHFITLTSDLLTRSKGLIFHIISEVTKLTSYFTGNRIVLLREGGCNSGLFITRSPSERHLQTFPRRSFTKTSRLTSSVLLFYETPSNQHKEVHSNIILYKECRL